LQVQCRSVVNYVLAAGIAIGIGLLSEIAQIPGPRDAQKADIITDALGIIGAIGIAATFDRRIRVISPLWARIGLPLVASVGLVIAVGPALWFGYALINQKNAFPVLLSFEHRWETATFDQTGSQPGLIPAPDSWPGTSSTIVHGDDYGRRGYFLSLHPLPDWRGLDRIVFVAASVGEAYPLDIDIRDGRDESNAFFKRFQIGPDPQEFSITFAEIEAGTESGEFDFSRVDTVVFSAANPGDGHQLLLDNIRLEP
jgi:hypothetical protein